jgi:lysozyme family protein
MSDMIEAFEKAIAFVFRWEGFMSNDPADKGGLTKYGISKAAHPEVDVANLTRDEAVEIYRRNYWQKLGCDRLEPAQAIALFDGAVQHGPTTAARMMQRAAGVRDDGIIGPRSVLAINTAAQAVLLERYISERIRFYHQITVARPENSRFVSGWINRALALQTSCLQEVWS